MVPQSFGQNEQKKKKKVRSIRGQIFLTNINIDVLTMYEIKFI